MTNNHQTPDLTITPYVFPVYALIFGTLLLFHQRLIREHRLLYPRICWLKQVWTWVFLACCGAVFVTGVDVYALTSSLSPGRDASSFEVSLETFLTYGFIPIGHVLQGYLGGAPFDSDSTRFIGLVSLAVLAHCSVRQALGHGAAMFTAIGLGLFGLSLGGAVSTLAYYIPGISLYRHIGLLHDLAGLF